MHANEWLAVSHIGNDVYCLVSKPKEKFLGNISTVTTYYLYGCYMHAVYRGLGKKGAWDTNP